MNTVTLTSTFPCHPHRKVRLKATPGTPAERYDRTCKLCGQAWTITRRTLVLRGAGRVDALEWEAPNAGARSEAPTG